MSAWAQCQRLSKAKHSNDNQWFTVGVSELKFIKMLLCESLRCVCVLVASHSTPNFFVCSTGDIVSVLDFICTLASAVEGNFIARRAHYYAMRSICNRVTCNPRQRMAAFTSPHQCCRFGATATKPKTISHNLSIYWEIMSAGPQAVHCTECRAGKLFN